MFARLISYLSLVPVGIAFAGCSGFTSSDECDPGATSACDTQCGPGTMTCLSDGSWGSCEMTSVPECLPSEYGSCDVAADAPPGLWFCSDDCHRGPCRDLCLPGDTSDCMAQCGPGVHRCQDNGTWSDCREYVLPPCRPGDAERCEDGEGHRRCTDECDFGPCEIGACTPGEISECGLFCASQVCLADGTWSECTADVGGTACSPDETDPCDAPCGPGQRVCNERCEWNSCREFEPVACHPGDRQMCPTTLYCGLAFRVCNSSCDWGQCIETGD